MRAKCGHKNRHKAKEEPNMPELNVPAMKITAMLRGKESSRSVINFMNCPNRFRLKAPRRPTKVPAHNEIIRIIMAVKKEGAAPISNLDSRSLPRRSQPNRWVLSGEASDSEGSVLKGSKGARKMPQHKMRHHIKQIIKNILLHL